MVLADLLLNGIFFGAKLGLASLGFALIFYTTKDFHFAYGSLLAAAGWLGYLLIGTLQVPALLAMLPIFALIVAAGVGMQYLVYRHLPNAMSIMLISLGFNIILENLLLILIGPTDVVLSTTPLGNVLAFGDFRIRAVQLAILAAFALTTLALWDLLHHRRIGLALRAVMRDAAMSELVGIRAQRINLLAYAIGSAISVAAGLLVVVDTGVRSTTGFDVLMLGFIVTVLGGASLARMALWSVAVGIFMNLSSWQLPTQFQTMLVFAFMMIYVVVASHLQGTKLFARLRAA